MYYANVTGLRSKISSLYINSTNISHDVVCLTETWLCGSISDAELFGPEFIVFRRDRHNSLNAPVGGGVLCAVRRCIPCTLLEFANPEGLELLGVSLKLPDKNLLVLTAYIPPGAGSSTFEALSHIIEELSTTLRQSDELLLFGDFNMPSVVWRNSDDNGLLPTFASAPPYYSTFVDHLSSSGLTQCSNVANESNRFLDLIFSTDPDSTLVRRSLVPLLPESNHHPSLQVVLFIDPVAAASCVPDCCSFNFKKADYSRLNNLLGSCSWRAVFEKRDIDAAVDAFYKNLFTCITLCVPMSRCSKSVSDPPWLNGSLKHLKNLKTKAWKRFCSSGSDADFETYSKLRNEYILGLVNAYSDYILNMKSIISGEPRQFWRFVNSKRGTDGYPSLLRLGDFESGDPATVSNLFAEFFKTAFLDITCDISFNDFTSLTNFPATSLEMKDLFIDDEAVTEHIQSLTDNFSCGPDGIPVSFVKNCCNSIVPVLCYLFNLSISSGVFPTFWKSSFVIPLHKKGNKTEISNYRPVAKLCSIAKIFEALIYKVLRFHCKPFLGSFQHGFMKGKSTTTNLFEFSHSCTSAIEAGKQMDCIFTDFSKAFDRINHDILIYKLTALGFPLLFINWIRSYLSGRTQRVSFRGSFSNVIHNTSGVPQGSHLGPLLFIIYINDISACIKHSEILCYADDAKIFRVVSSVRDCEILNSDLDTFYKWCSINCLPLNVDKCTYMSFSRKRTNISFNYTINECVLTKLDKTRDLGVWLNCRFTFDDHINEIVNKANSTLGFVKRWCREFEDPYITRLLYCTFVRPILEYACCVWSPFYATHINRLEAVQRRFVRFALRGLPWSNPHLLPPYLDRLKLIKLDTLEHRRNASKTVFAMDCLRGCIESSVLLSLLNISVPSRSLRNRDFFSVSYHRTNYGFNEPIASMSRAFNRDYDFIDFNLSKKAVKAHIT